MQLLVPQEGLVRLRCERHDFMAPTAGHGDSCQIVGTTGVVTGGDQQHEHAGGAGEEREREGRKGEATGGGNQTEDGDTGEVEGEFHDVDFELSCTQYTRPDEKLHEAGIALLRRRQRGVLLLERRFDQPVVTVVLRRLQFQHGAHQIVEMDVFGLR